MKIRCIIVDDEPLALDILEDYIRRIPTLELAGRFTNSREALEFLNMSGGRGEQEVAVNVKGGGGSESDGGREGTGSRGIDLAFLDIQMPGLGGLELAQSMYETRLTSETRVIFTTAFPGYALDGFRVDALDYLLKPISFAEFSRAVERAVEWFGIKRAAEKAQENGAGTADGAGGDTGLDSGAGDRDFSSSATSDGGDTKGGGTGTPRMLMVKSGYKQFIIPIETIVYIEGIRDYICIHTVDYAGRTGSMQTLMNMKSVEGRLPSGRFARIHRSYIVNIDRVAHIERGHVVLAGSAGDDEVSEPVSLPVSETYKEALASLLASRAL